jgi:hypothetical protein
MASSAVRAVVVAAVLAFVLSGWARGKSGDDARTVVSGSWDETYAVAPADRRAGLRFAPGVATADRKWIKRAIAAARPEARMLIAEVDGLIVVHTHVGDPFGVTEVRPPDGYAMGLDIGAMDRDRVQDRESTVLHELGHVVDHALVPAETNRTLDDGIPRGACTSSHGLTGSCTAPEERFADTFAKWALRGAVSEVGAGYGVASPASLEDWGAPLARLAIEVSTRR